MSRSRSRRSGRSRCSPWVGCWRSRRSAARCAPASCSTCSGASLAYAARHPRRRQRRAPRSAARRPARGAALVAAALDMAADRGRTAALSAMAGGGARCERRGGRPVDHRRLLPAAAALPASRERTALPDRDPVHREPLGGLRGRAASSRSRAAGSGSSTRATTPLFYGHALTAARYRTWLHSLGVRFVAVPDVALDPSGAQEAELIAGGLRYLRLVFRSAHWRVYAVVDPSPVVQGTATLGQTRTRQRHDARRTTRTLARAGQVESVLEAVRRRVGGRLRDTGRIVHLDQARARRDGAAGDRASHSTGSDSRSARCTSAI